MQVKLFIISAILSIIILGFFIKPEPEPVMPVISTENLQEPEFYLPVLNGVISSGFGSRDGKAHEGTDIAVPLNTKIHSAMAGVVRFAGTLDGYGLTVVVAHDDDFITLYAHLNSVIVKKGDLVFAGDIIAYSGNSGTSTGPHLHFEIRKDEIPLNPEDFIKI